MKKKSNYKKIKSRINSLENLESSLFKKLTEKELIEINGGNSIFASEVGNAGFIRSFDVL